MTRLWCFLLLMLASGAGCMDKPPKPYGQERQLMLPSKSRQIWAVAPAVNLSGQREVDPILQADIVFEQLQQVGGLTMIPVNRVAQVYLAMGVENVQSPEQAQAVCDALGADALLVPTVTIYDPYNPPKFGGALQLFMRPGPAKKPAARKKPAAAAPPGPAMELVQSVGMYDAANGSVRKSVLEYAAGRNDPQGSMGPKEYFINMDRFNGFAYRALTELLIREMQKGR